MITIDGRSVPARGTVLDACRAAGSPVPTLCHDPRLSRGAHCRACLVQMDGEYVAACCTPAREGAEVRTDTPELREYRRDLGELMLAETAPAGAAREQIARWGAEGRRYPRRPREAVRDHTHPHVRLDLDRCILCRRCLRACEEIQGEFVFAVEGRGASVRLAWGGVPFVDGACVACGACLTVCPSEALTSRDTAPHFRDVRVTRTTCGECAVGCQLDVHVTDGPEERVSHVEAAALEPPNRGHLCARGRFAHRAAEARERLVRPLVRRHGKLEPASWSEAIAAAAEGLLARRGAAGAVGSARGTNEELFLLQEFVRGVLGTNDVDTGSRIEHAPSDVALREAFGVAAATASLDDLERADVLVVTGADPDRAHPVLGARLRQAALAGATLVVIDPCRTELARLADVHLQLRPGTNVPLLNSLACVLVEEGTDPAFIEAHTQGWETFAPFVRLHTPERWQDATGVPAALVRRAARLIGRAKRPWFAHGLGVTEHLQGTDAVRLLANLALLTGAAGREGAGVVPLRGEANAQGALDVGCAPDRLAGGARVDDRTARARIAALEGHPAPERPGRRVEEMMAAARGGELTALLVLGEDVLGSAPDGRGARRAIERLEWLVVADTWLTPTAEHAHVVLPIADVLEKEGTFTSLERRVQRVRRALDPPGEAREALLVLRELFAACGGAAPADDAAGVLDAIARAWPEGAGLTASRLDRGALAWPVPAADHPGTKRLGPPPVRAKLACVDFERSPGLRGTLVLSTGRRLERIAASRPPATEPDAEEWLELHPDDAAERGVDEGDRVHVRSEHGEALLRVRLSERLRRGSAFLSFHHAGASADTLAGRVRDRETGCPEYKVVAIEVEHADG